MFRFEGSKHPSIQEWKYISHTKNIVQFKIFLKHNVHLNLTPGPSVLLKYWYLCPAFNSWMITYADWGQMRGSCYQISEQPSDYRKMERGKPDLSASLEKIFWEFLDALAPLYLKLSVISGSYFLMLWLTVHHWDFGPCFSFSYLAPVILLLIYYMPRDIHTPFCRTLNIGQK